MEGHYKDKSTDCLCLGFEIRTKLNDVDREKQRWGTSYQEIVRASSFDATDNRGGIRVAGNSTAGGERETSSTFGPTEAGGGGRSRTGSPDNTPNGTRTVADGTGARRGRWEWSWITRQCIAGTRAGARFLFRCHGISDVALPWDTGPPVCTACEHVCVSYLCYL